MMMRMTMMMMMGDNRVIVSNIGKASVVLSFASCRCKKKENKNNWHFATPFSQTA